MRWFIIISNMLEYHCDGICYNEYDAGAPLWRGFVIISTMLEYHCEVVCNDEYNAGAPL